MFFTNAMMHRFGELYRSELASVMYRRGKKLLGRQDLALDAVQEAVARIWSHMRLDDDYRLLDWPLSQQRAYAAQVTTNVSLDMIKKAKTRADAEARYGLSLLPVEPATPATFVLKHAGPRLAAAHKDVLAAILDQAGDGPKSGSVRVRVSRLRSELRDILVHEKLPDSLTSTSWRCPDLAPEPAVDEPKVLFVSFHGTWKGK